MAERLVPGSMRVVAPAATIAFSNVIVRLCPLSAATEMLWASTNVPQPSTSVILFFFIRKWMPLVIRSDTWRLRENALP